MDNNHKKEIGWKKQYNHQCHPWMAFCCHPRDISQFGHKLSIQPTNSSPVPASESISKKLLVQTAAMSLSLDRTTSGNNKRVQNLLLTPFLLCMTMCHCLILLENKTSVVVRLMAWVKQSTTVAATVRCIVWSWMGANRIHGWDTDRLEGIDHDDGWPYSRLHHIC